jgi:transcriptional regulator with XRE-family HTH domain
MTKIRDQEFLNQFGQRIRKLRLENNLSQFDLEAISNIDRVQIERIENGKVNTTISTAAQIAKAFNISLSKLFDF